ncbi:type VII secretion target [Mycolicibacterium hodleri]|uniref:ESX-1 secretion-associated protein n=1 Tax=Mycolicibacterium hodleri TaxID=49897 RepID=A0A502E9M6_9MYCO|nr:type VII secretion target [Mycolicibacterium hodleri]TPG34405.1 ESX-1 secretion-associated protein [Mycolicibacterium hodleri]
MGENESAYVDVEALLDLAGRCDTVAEMVDGLARTHLGRLMFDGAVAGRDYIGRGDAVRRAVDAVVDPVHVWSRAMREIASALRTSTGRYAEADALSATRLG